jgi:hypothetical protein
MVPDACLGSVTAFISERLKIVGPEVLILQQSYLAVNGLVVLLLPFGESAEEIGYIPILDTLRHTCIVLEGVSFQLEGDRERGHLEMPVLETILEFL